MHHENACLFQLTIENQVCMLLSVDIENVGINPRYSTEVLIV